MEMNKPRKFQGIIYFTRWLDALKRVIYYNAMEDVMTTDAQEAAKWNAAGANRTAEDIAASRAKAAEMLKTCGREYDVTVRRGGFASFGSDRPQ